MNEDCYHEQNSCYNFNTFGFDQFLPHQLIDQTPLEESMKNLRIALQAWSENIQQKKEEEEKQIVEEQAAKARHWKIPICYDDGEDYTIAITPKEPDNSLSMGDEHLDSIPATESDEFIKFSVKNLVPNPSESKGEHECDVPACDDFTTFSNLLFDADDDFSSRIDKADYDPEEEIRLDERLLYDNSSPRPSEEFNFENSDAIIKSFSPSPIPVKDSDPFMEEFDLFLASDGSIPPGIDNDYSDSEGDNLFLERLLHDDHIPLPNTLDFSYVIRVFLPFFTYPVTSSILLSSQLVHEDLEQIHEDDLEEMDLKWQLALLSMMAKRFFQKIRKKITINGSDTAGYDKSKVECFNCHKMEHFVRECRVPRNQENRTMNQETTRRTVNVEDTSSKAMVVINEASFDWSYMADDEAPTNMAFMALLGSEESDEEDEVESPPKKERKTVEPSVNKARCKYHQKERMLNGTNHSRVNHNANTIPKAMLTTTGLKPVNSVRPVNPKINFQRTATYNNRNFFKKVNTAKEKVNTARPNSVVLNAVRANKGKAVKASAFNTVRQSNDFFGADDDIRSLDGVELDISNISITYHIPTTPNTRINKDHSLDNVIGDIQSSVQTRRMTGCSQEEGIDYDEVFAPVARIKAIRLFLAYASFMGFFVYQMDVKSAFLSMIGSLMYLTSSRPDIMFVICTCAKFQYKKQTVVATSTTKAEYVEAASCCGQVLWIQNRLLDYGKTRTKIERIGIRIPQSNVPSSAADEAITKEMHDGLGRATTTASSLAVEQGSDNISKTYQGNTIWAKFSKD
nr:hypothetical protein [Tanacetum cinerariifolium]